jgi:hypothetical protein
VLTPRWTVLRPIAVQRACWQARYRFVVNPAGRRSLKTELSKRRLVKAALRGTQFPRPRFVAAAPTYLQAKRIFWQDLKELTPEWALRGRPSEGELVISLQNSAEIHVTGMDVPARIEGVPLDGIVLDEYGDMREEAWPRHVRPALSDRRGWARLIGVPEGRNHYYDLYERARAEMIADPAGSEWGAFHWTSAATLPAVEVEAARRELDARTFQQEYEASFVNFAGRAYYVFEVDVHAAQVLRPQYQPEAPLGLCFDFNVSPGVAVVVQEGPRGTMALGEVHIPRNSNTPAVCRRLVADWGKHPGPVRLHGDATGGARGTAQVAGSDWELIERELRPVFGGRLTSRVPRANPGERARINAVNTRLQSGDGTVRLWVDPHACPNLVRDLEGVRVLEGGSGQIDKKADPKLSHLSDALGYYIAAEFPIDGDRAASQDMDFV